MRKNISLSMNGRLTSVSNSKVVWFSQFSNYYSGFFVLWSLPAFDMFENEHFEGVFFE